MTDYDFRRYEKTLKQLEYISSIVGTPVEYTQGGGGNTSVKLDDRYMAVKASGCQLKQITAAQGYVVIDYKKIKDYYDKVNLSIDEDYEKTSSALVKQSIIDVPWLKKMRPSVEAGFHSVLGKYVIHTHSVYANILNCIEGGSEHVEKIFSGKIYKTAVIPYISPGFFLTIKIMEALSECCKRTGKTPEVFFLQNHGLIIASDDYRKAVELHSEVNEEIRKYFGITEAFPSVELVNTNNNIVLSKSSYIKNYLECGDIRPDFFNKVILYPDQYVYLSGGIGINSDVSRLNINTLTGEVEYRTGESEARTMEETLIACIYVINEIKKRSLPLKTLSQSDIDFLKNWEGEGYRKKMAQGQPL